MPEVDDLSPGQLIMNSYAGRFDDLSVPLWLNLGYWKKAQSYTKACEDLAALVATTAEFGGNARVLDAGCGFAEPARFWATKYGVKVHAINNDLFQVDVASARIERLNLADQVRVTHGAATKLALPWQCFDAVVALESAFQFNTRE
ncbi:MAG: class I SAM-dependent methyltransferase, partial [Haliea sp.]